MASMLASTWPARRREATTAHLHVDNLQTSHNQIAITLTIAKHVHLHGLCMNFQGCTSGLSTATTCFAWNGRRGFAPQSLLLLVLAACSGGSWCPLHGVVATPNGCMPSRGLLHECLSPADQRLSMPPNRRMERTSVRQAVTGAGVTKGVDLEGELRYK